MRALLTLGSLLVVSVGDSVDSTVDATVDVIADGSVGGWGLRSWEGERGPWGREDENVCQVTEGCCRGCVRARSEAAPSHLAQMKDGQHKRTVLLVLRAGGSSAVQ